MIGLPITFALATSGCATKKYVRNQVDVVNQRVSQVETKTNQEIASLTSKHDEDISQVKERIMTTDNKVAENAAATNTVATTFFIASPFLTFRSSPPAIPNQTTTRSENPHATRTPHNHPDRWI